MSKVYMYRHQVAGIINSHVFMHPPTASQISPIRSECERLHGKTGWERIVEVDLLVDEIPVFPDRPDGGNGKRNIANAGDISVSGNLEVSNG